MCINNVSFDQPYELAFLFNYDPKQNKDCSTIVWVDKPLNVGFEKYEFSTTISILMDVTSNILSFINASKGLVQYIGISKTSSASTVIESLILKIDNYYSFDGYLKILCTPQDKPDSVLMQKLRQSYNQRFLTNAVNSQDRKPQMDTEVTETESTYIDPDNIDKWLRNFQIKYGDTMTVDDSVLTHLACELCNDIPLGYEASHRLANWIFCHINASKYSDDTCTCIEARTDEVLAAERKLFEAYTAYKEKINQVVCLLDLRTTKTPIIL